VRFVVTAGDRLGLGDSNCETVENTRDLRDKLAFSCSADLPTPLALRIFQRAKWFWGFGLCARLGLSGECDHVFGFQEFSSDGCHRLSTKVRLWVRPAPTLKLTLLGVQSARRAC